MRHILISLLAAMAFTMPSVAQTKGSGPNIGDSAPPLDFQTLLQAPEDVAANWARLKGKVVVLEFWATWCGPCIAAIPHLNSLSDHFKDQPVQFIAISDEDDKVIVPFLKRKPIHAWVGLNTNKSMFTAYGISGIPHTVVVDRDGKVAEIMYPASLTEAVVADVLAGKKMASASKSSGGGITAGELPDNAENSQPSLLQVVIRRAVKDPRAGECMSFGNGSVTITRCAVFDALPFCYKTTPSRLVTNCALPDGVFDFVVKFGSQNNNKAGDWLRRAVEDTFGLSAKREIRPTDVFVLSATPSAGNRLTPTVSNGGSTSQGGPGYIRAVNHGMGDLARSLEGCLKTPVVDETDLTNHYDYELTWKGADEDPSPDVVAKALHDQLGLELKPARRPIKVVVISKATNKDK